MLPETSAWNIGNTRITQYFLVIDIAMENGPFNTFIDGLPVNMVSFHSYVKLPEFILSYLSLHPSIYPFPYLPTPLYFGIVYAHVHTKCLYHHGYVYNVGNPMLSYTSVKFRERTLIDHN